MWLAGENVIGATIADGWYAGYCAYGLFTKQAGLDKKIFGRYYYGKNPALKAQLEITNSDGSTQTVATDKTWKSSLGPITEADILMGENYDARKELTGWSAPGYDDSAWKAVIAYAGTEAIHDPNPGVAVRPIRELKPISVKEHKPSVWIFDLGQNIAGVIRLKVKGKAGDKVTIRYAEMLHQDGRWRTAQPQSGNAGTATYPERASTIRG